MRATILELHSSSETGYSRLSEIAALSARLHDGIRSLRASFAAGRILDETPERVRGALAAAAAAAVIRPSRGSQPLSDGSLDDFAKAYTMHAEREVHRGVAGVPGAPLREGPHVVAGLQDDDLGENVDLF